MTKSAINQNRITLTALILIVLGGINAYQNMPQNEDPGFIIRTAQVLTLFPGASPERVELLVTDKLEKTIQEIPELDFVTSTSRNGLSEIYVNIQEKESDMRPIWDNLRRKIERAARNLPIGVIGPIVNDEFGDVFGTIITLTGEGYSYAELKEIADQVRNELLKISETAKVEIHGAQEEHVFVEYNTARLAELGVSAFQVKSTLEARNILLPGGDINTGRERIILEPSGNFESVDDLRHTVVKVPGSTQMVYLSDIALVKRGYADPPNAKISASGIPALAMAISMREGGNLISMGQSVLQTIRRLEEQYPIGIEFDVISFQPRVVEQKIDEFVSNLIQAVVIVIVVMLFSLGVRTGLIVSSLIPMAMVMSILVMSMFAIGLDQMSLAALIISLGLLVDNSIVISESILVRMTVGEKVFDAAIATAAELRIPLLTSSLTTAAAFLPIYLAESATGEYTAPLFKVITITLLCSWVLSLTMIPLLCVYFMKVKPGSKPQSFDTRIYLTYRNLLIWCLKRPVVTLAITIAIFMVTLQGAANIPNTFFPPKVQTMFTAEFVLPIGTPIERTEAILQEVNAFIEKELKVGPDRTEGVNTWAAFIGQSPPRYMLTYAPKAPSPEYAMMLINTSSYDIINSDLIPRLERFCLENFPDVKPTIRSLMNGPPVSDPIEVRISGENADEVFDLSDKIKDKLASISGTKNIGDDWGMRTKKLAVKIDQPRARRAGLTSQDVAVSLQTGLSGIETTQYREGDEIIPVTLRSVAADRKDFGKLESLSIFSQITGRTVPLNQVADIEVVWQPAKILRRDRLQTVTVSASLDPGVTAVDVVNQLDTWLLPESETWPVGYKYAYGGEIEASVKANESVGAKMPIAGLVILLLLVGQFNSLRRPAIILLTIPLGLVGVIIGLLITGAHFGFMTFLGVISLAGIVINNAIVLIDRIKIEIEENSMESAPAVVQACLARLRPILLTTCTTIAGMLPLWYGGGPMFGPMAIAIIFGLFFATGLTLIFVPVLYSLFFHVKYKAFQ
ncbi:MAG: multidrug efflux pump [Candidatus Latescibacterota bacterium]|jgi:multidrug efflux pump